MPMNVGEVDPAVTGSATNPGLKRADGLSIDRQMGTQLHS